MKDPIICEIEYFSSPHLNQIYKGFELLRQKNIITKPVLKKATGDPTKPLLKVTINKKIKIIYDTLDGFNWIIGNEAQNLEYFRNNTQADFYFKRSYKEIIQDFAPTGCKILPLGLNYDISHNLNNKGFLDLRNRLLPAKYRNNFSFKKFEDYPIPNQKNQILFLTRLWDPYDKEGKLNIRIENINTARINYIKVCRKEFRNSFIGGLTDTPYARKFAKELILDHKYTNRDHFMKSVKDSNICIATTGLHESIGWKFGEYIAASRAVLSEPLYYQLPGDFGAGNYIEFDSADQLLNGIARLMDNKDKMISMMHTNYMYYNNYVRPDNLVLNSLLEVFKQMD